MELKRVVVTGLGAVTPLGNTPEETWENMVKGVSGAAPITLFDATNDNRQTLPRFQPEAIRQNMRIVEVLNAFGRTRGITPAQVALAWLLNKKPFIVPIPGTTKLSHLEENLRASDIRFAAETVKELEDAVAAIPVTGSRYDALQESKIQR